MINFKRILYPVDFSVQSRAVAPSVTAMAKRFGSEVVLLHVAGAPAPKIELDRFAAEAFSEMPVVRELVEGDPARQIVRYAGEHKVDLIMMPSRGHGPFRALLLGSVTAKVMREAHCPVWTSVHAEESASHSPNSWNQMLCAVDDADGRDVHVLQWASEFAQEQGAMLHVVHAVAGTEGMWTQEREPSMYDFLFRAARERLARLQAEAGTAFEIELAAGSVGSVVHRTALEGGADLIVIGRGGTQKAFEPLGSNAYSIILEAPCPAISI